LKTRLNADATAKLRESQRNWINWRDSKCDELESYCTTGSCAGVAHDSCIIDLTNIRAKELQAFVSHTDRGINSNFSYSTNYPEKIPFSKSRE
jgi:uncharacterized protein YecT (DUF1311 family)